MYPTRLLPALLVSLLAAAVCAQEDGAPDKGGAGGRGAKGLIQPDVDAEAKAAQEDGGNEKAGFKLEKVEPRQLSARGRCRFDGAVRPKRLLPGQPGKLLITMVFEADNVMKVPTTLTLTPLGNTVVVSGWSLSEPIKGTVAKAFVGQDVYDNWALIEVDVTLPNSARLGDKVQAVMQLEFDLHEGSTGNLVGHFVERVNVPIEVGVASDPTVLGLGAGTGGPTPPGASAAALPSTTAAPSGTEPSDGGAGPARRDPVANVVPAPAVAAEPSGTGPAHEGSGAPPVATSSSSMPLVIGGGAAAIALLVLLLRRRG